MNDAIAFIIGFASGAIPFWLLLRRAQRELEKDIVTMRELNARCKPVLTFEDINGEG